MTDQAVIRLLHHLDGHLGLAVHRGMAGDEEWIREADALIHRTRQTIDALGARKVIDLDAFGEAHAREVDRLWPGEEQPAFRAQCLAEEAGEVSRAITKRRHAQHAPDGLCKGKTVEEWTKNLEVEIAQTLGVLLDMAYREGIDATAALVNVLQALQDRKPG